MKAAIYARVSTDDKEQNPETQLMALRDYCRQKGYEIYREYVDQARAKDYRGRKEWTQLLKDMRQRKFQAILVYKLDRMSRETIYTLTVLRDLEERGIKFISITQDIDTSTTTGKAFMQMLAIWAETESGMIGDRVRSGIARRKAEGGRFGRKPLAITSQSIYEAIRECNGSRSAAAKILNCSVPYIYKILGPIKPSQNPARKSGIKTIEKGEFTKEVFYEAP